MKKNKYFEDLKESLNAAIDYERGKLDVRTTELEIPPLPKLTKKKIKTLREDILGVSQTLFARILGVSPAAVKAWEQGSKQPSGTARRLMQLVEQDPNTLLKLTGLQLAKSGR
ncbi:MAG: helix-turn-helix domain-containing protein [Bdellovibrionales bacterium]|nr:helix-turn-helix domain-containing protein [Bdellovibrionales bacterium]